MGQYFKAIILEKNNTAELIRTWVDPRSYNMGGTLMEHSYKGNKFVASLEYLISPLGMFYMSPVVWAGDYANREDDSSPNLNLLAEEEPFCKRMSNLPYTNMFEYRYIVNHSKKQYVDKNYEFDNSNNFHPLPLLTAEGNGRGSGDYKGFDIELVGTWARDILSVELDIPYGFTELVCKFSKKLTKYA